MTTKPRILLVEDERHLAFNLQLNLEQEGYEVVVADDGLKALTLFEKLGPFDLLIVDVMLPELNGFEVVKKIRQQNAKIGLIMLTAKASDQDRVRGLRLGVDDYITKPFHLEELLARVKRAIERASLLESTPDEAGGIYQVEPFSLDTRSLQLETPAGCHSLTALEADLLAAFFQSPGKVLSREYLLSNVWGVEATMETRTVDNFVGRLRKFLEEDPANPKYLQSVRGRGYRLTL